MNAAPELSLIIPVGPQETHTPRLTESDISLPSRWEKILSLGPEMPVEPPPQWQVLQGPFGRGRQLNHAAWAATGSWLWFVHADSLPDPDAIASVSRFIQNPARRAGAGVLGYSKLKFDSDGPKLTRLNALGANLRSRWLNLPYGDQGYCIRKADFVALGGFRDDLVRGEDLDFLVRARAEGLSIQAMGGTVTTSARRYGLKGWLKTTIAHQLAAFRLIRNARRRGLE